LQSTHWQPARGVSSSASTRRIALLHTSTTQNRLLGLLSPSASLVSNTFALFPVRRSAYSLLAIPSIRLRSGGKGYFMSVQASTLDLHPSVVSTNAWRSRTLAVILMLTIVGIFWVDSRYPALLKRYHAGTQVKAAGALTFGTVYQVDRTMPLSTRVWRTTINWLDANRIGMTFSFLFGPAALTFLATLRRRRTSSR